MPWSNQPGGPWSSGPRGPWGSGPQQQGPRPPDLEEFLLRSQDKLRGLLPGNLGGRGVALIALVLVALWGFSGFYRVEPDEVGIVLRFGKYVGGEVQPGLNYHLPYPIETVRIAGAAGQQNGYRHAGERRRRQLQRSAGREPDAHRRREYRRCRFLGAVEDQDQRGRRLSLQHPESGRHREGSRRKRDARSDRTLECAAAAHRPAPKRGDRGPGTDAADAQLYGAGIVVQNVQLQKVDPPAEGGSTCSATCRLPAPTWSGWQNEAQTYANRVVPEARGRAAKIIQDAEAYRSQTVADAKGQTLRFLQIYEQYKNAPDVTRERMYLETMEHILSSTNKTILDTGSRNGPVGRALSAAQRDRHAGARSGDGARRRWRQAMSKKPRRRCTCRHPRCWSVIISYGTFFTVDQTSQALVVRLGQPVQGHHRAGT